MKKVLMLGGSNFQVPSIKTAVAMGFHTISCDYLPDNPGHKFAHEYYNVSTTDKEAVLELAKKLKVDGVVCYASDPAATVAAYVCEKLGLPTSPYKSVETLANKDKFRAFLKDNGFKTPKAMGYSDSSAAIKEIGDFSLPVIIKPVDSSGSKGVTKLNDVSKLKEQIEYALSFSRAKRFIIEEFIEKDIYQIMGEGFSVNGKLVFRCFANHHFDDHSNNPFSVVGGSFPSIRSKEIHENIHNELQRLITLLKMKSGAYNFEIRLDKNKNLFLMELGPRNGGNFIPQLIKYATGVDMVEYTIKAAMGMDCSDLKQVDPHGFYSYYVLHSHNSGILKEIWIEDGFRKNNLVEFNLFFNPGDKIDSYTGSNKTLGVMILKFSSEQEMIEKMDNMQNHVRVIV